MTISTKDCKDAIVEFCKNNDVTIIKEVYGDYKNAWIGKIPNSFTEASEPMKKTKNWSRMFKRNIHEECLSLEVLMEDISARVNLDKDLSKEEKNNIIQNFANKIKNNKVYYRGFNCIPYDDQLRAYVYATDSEILLVQIQGE